MSTSTNRFTEQMSRKLQAAGLNEAVIQSSGDAWGKYLIRKIGGRCIAGAGWTQSECRQIIAERCQVIDQPE
jgi:hypothetical protein